MSGMGNPFKEIPIILFEALKRKITQHERCHFCNRKKRLSKLDKDFLSRYKCKDSNGPSDCERLNI